LLGLGLALALAGTALARDDRPMVIESADAQKHVSALLHTIRWHKSLDEALAAAKSQGKLVFWLQVKGDLDGAT
jgi:hypothetical protein